MNNRIIWRKWSDPLAPLVEGYRPREDEDDVAFHSAVESFNFDGETATLPMREMKDGGTSWSGPVISGLMGFIPLLESNLPGVLFNFWIGDANFDLTPRIVRAIERVPGVETLDIMTRYRFRLGVGRAFNEDEVKRFINRIVQPPVIEPASPAKATHQPLDGIKRSLSSKFSHWAIFILPGQKYEYAGADTIEEVMAKAKKYVGLAERTIFSWEK